MPSNTDVIDTCLIAACIKAAGTVARREFKGFDAAAINAEARELYRLVTAEPWKKG